MTAIQIYDGLLDAPSEHDPDMAAKAGFLEWAMTLPFDCVADAVARDALIRIGNATNANPAARLFVSMLELVAHTAPVVPHRKGGARAARKRRLH